MAKRFLIYRNRRLKNILTLSLSSVVVKAFLLTCQPKQALQCRPLLGHGKKWLVSSGNHERNCSTPKLRENRAGLYTKVKPSETRNEIKSGKQGGKEGAAGKRGARRLKRPSPGGDFLLYAEEGLVMVSAHDRPAHRQCDSG